MAGNFCRSPIHLLFSIRDDPTLATSTLPCVCCIFQMQAVESARIGSVRSQTWDILTAHAAMPAFHVGVIMYLAGEVCSEQHRQKEMYRYLPTYLPNREASSTFRSSNAFSGNIHPFSNPSLAIPIYLIRPANGSRSLALTHSLTPSPPSYKSPFPPPRTSPYTPYPPAATPACQSNTPYHFPDPLSKTD